MKLAKIDKALLESYSSYVLHDKSKFINILCNTKNALMIIFMVVSIMFAAAFFDQLRISEKYKAQLIEKNMKINELEVYNEEKAHEYADKYYASHLKLLMSSEELTLLAQKNWQYGITLNGEIVKKNTIYLNGETARIILSEVLINNSALPQEILEKGTVTGDDSNDKLQDHISVFTDILYASRIEKTNQGRRVIYDFSNIESGTVIGLKLSPVLSWRLKDSIRTDEFENIIEIIRK